MILIQLLIQVDLKPTKCNSFYRSTTYPEIVGRPMNDKTLCYLVLVLILTMPFRSVHAEWNAQLIPPSIGQNNLTIILTEPDTQQLSVELDNIDITDLIIQNENRLNYRPANILSAGQHTLRLLATDENGNSSVKANWSFITQAAASTSNNTEAWLTSASFNAETLTEFSNRIESRNLGSDAPRHTVASGGGAINAQAQGESWAVTAEGNYLLQSEKSLRQTNSPLDIGDYTLSALHQGDAFNTKVTVGHHDIGLDSLLMSQFHRRGLSASIESAEQRISAKAFAMTPDNLIGTDNISGFNESNSRLDGFATTIKPFSSDQNALAITTMYYDGERTQEGYGIGALDETATGSGWGVSAEKQWFDRQLKFQSHYARSQFDIDGDVGLAPEDDSNAFSFLLEATPVIEQLIFDRALNVTVGSKYERIDTFFQSLANQGLAGDRDAATVYSNIYWDNLSLDMQWSTETNNVDDLAGLPTDKLQQFLWNSSYLFTPSDEPNHWLGSPYLNFSGFMSTLSRDKSPLGYIGSDTDNRSRSITVGGGSNYETVYWTVSHTFGHFNDNANIVSDTTNDLSSFGLGWQVTDSLLLNGNVQYATFKDKDIGRNSYDTQFSLGVISQLIADKLNLNLNYNLNQSAGDNDSPDRHIINTELGWTLRQASYNKPGFNLALRGSLEKTHGNALFIDNQSTYQLFAVFTISAPFSGQY